MAEFTGVFLPKEILCIKELNLTEKLLLSQIIPLCVSEPCYASNSFFAERIGITETTVSTALKSLDDKGYLQTILDRKAGNKRVIEIFYYNDTLFKNFKDPSLKTLNTLFKNLKDPLKNSYIPYLKNLKTLFKNLNFIYKDESKEESKDYSKEEIIEVEQISDEILQARILELEKENQLLKEKREKEKSSAKKEKEAKFDFKQALINEGVEENVASDFMLVRKEKKAPSTETAFKLILNECERNQFSINEAIKTCINKNWQSFKYDWYVNLNTNARNSNTTETKTASDNPLANAFGIDNNRQEGKPMYRFINPAKVPSFGYVGQEQEV